VKGLPNKILMVLAAVVGVVLLIWVVFVDMIIERAIEREGTRAVGARVELDGAHLSLFPPGLTLDRLQVTDPGRAMTNAVEVDRVSATVDLGLLLRKKVRIPEMTIERVRFGTPRDSSGAVTGGAAGEKTEKRAPAFKIPSIDFPDPVEILKKERLESIEILNSLKAEIKSAQNSWSGELEKILDRKKLDEFRRRAEALSSAAEGGPIGIIGAAAEIASLQKDVTAYIDGIKDTRKRLNAEIENLKRRASEARRAPERDIQRLKEKYSFASGGLKNLSALIVGERVASITEEAANWYERLMPVIADARAGKKGTQAAAKKRDPGDTTPDLYVESAVVSVEVAAGRIAGEVKNISSGPGRPESPATFSFSGTGLQGLDSVKVDGMIDRTDPSTPADSATVVVKGYRARDVKLTEAASMPVTLSDAVVDLSVETSLKGAEGLPLTGRALKAEITAGIREARISASPREGSNQVVRALADTLSEIKKFRMEALVEGTLDDYDIKMSSDLDQVLGRAVGDSISSAAASFERKLRDSIMDKTRGPIGELGGDLKGLDAISNKLQGRITESGGLLGTIGARAPSPPDSGDDAIEPGLPIKLPGGIRLPF
jgi:uncharacterized protein (TIGR03545 family)